MKKSKFFLCATVVFVLIIVFSLISNTVTATVGQQLLTPESEWNRYETDGITPYDSYFEYSNPSNWQTAYYANDFSYGSTRWTQVQNESISFTFTGSKLRIIGAKNGYRSTHIHFSIDGGNPVDFSQYPTSGDVYMAVIYEILSGIDYGQHEVTISLQDSAVLEVDAIDTDGTLDDPNGTPTPTPTPADYYIDFDHYPDSSDIDGTVSNGSGVWPGTIITNQYTEFGAVFNSTNGGPIASVGYLPEASSSPNFLVGNPNSYQPITVDIVNPSTGTAATAGSIEVTLISVGRSTVTVNALAADLVTVLDSKIVHHDEGPIDGACNQDPVPLTGPGIARITFQTNYTTDDGYGIDDLYIYSLSTGPTPTPTPTITVGEPLPTPEAGWQRIETNDQNGPTQGFTFGPDISDWIQYYNNGEPWSGNGTMHTSVSNPSLSFSFTGTKLRIIGAIYGTRCSNITITIDSQQYTFSAYGSLQYASLLFFPIDNLGSGQHNVTITEPTGYVFEIDAIDIDSNGTFN